MVLEISYKDFQVKTMKAQNGLAVLSEKEFPKDGSFFVARQKCLALSGGQLYKFLTEVSYKQRLLRTGLSTSALINYWYASLDLVYLFDYSTCTHTSN